MTRPGTRLHYAVTLLLRSSKPRVPRGSLAPPDTITSAYFSDISERSSSGDALPTPQNDSDADPARRPNRYGRPCKHGKYPRSP
jgi:hypothetical protein